MKSAPKPLLRNSVEQLVVQTLAGDLVEGAERLVEQEHRRIHHQRAGERGAHPHAARELLGVLRLEPGEPDELDRLGDPGLAHRLRHLAELGEERDVRAAPCATAGAWRPGRRSRASLRSTVTMPALGRSRPEATRSSVDLPHPLGPTIVTNSPGATLSDVGARARVPSGNVLATPSNTSAGRDGRSGRAAGIDRIGFGERDGHHGSDLVHDHSAGDVHRLAGAVVAVARRQEQRHRRHVGRLGAASERRRRAPRRHHLRRCAWRRPCR